MISRVSRARHARRPCSRDAPASSQLLCATAQSTLSRLAAAQTCSDARHGAGLRHGPHPADYVGAPHSTARPPTPSTRQKAESAQPRVRNEHGTNRSDREHEHRPALPSQIGSNGRGISTLSINRRRWCCVMTMRSMQSITKARAIRPIASLAASSACCSLSKARRRRSKRSTSSARLQSTRWGLTDSSRQPASEAAMTILSSAGSALSSSDGASDGGGAPATASGCVTTLLLGSATELSVIS
mmetsp:Transcript_8410/g.21621  ORF Transcript_8410/g.21621 Transcript_8410/m.21621 type:complete len:243 (+) Transcript_8410:117-845(+)